MPAGKTGLTGNLSGYSTTRADALVLAVATVFAFGCRWLPIDPERREP